MASSVASSRITAYYTLRANYAKPKIAWHEKVLSILAEFKSDINEQDRYRLLLPQRDAIIECMRMHIREIASHESMASVYASEGCQQAIYDLIKTARMLRNRLIRLNQDRSGTLSSEFDMTALFRDIFAAQTKLQRDLKGILPNKKASKSHDST